MRSVHHFIGGRRFTGASGRFGDIFDPNLGTVQARVDLATAEELDSLWRPPAPPSPPGPV